MDEGSHVAMLKAEKIKNTEILQRGCNCVVSFILYLNAVFNFCQVFMFGTVSKWIGVYNIWYYGVFMALNGN